MRRSAARERVVRLNYAAGLCRWATYQAGMAFDAFSEGVKAFGESARVAEQQGRNAKRMKMKQTLWRIVNATIGAFVAIVVMRALGIIRFVPMSPTRYLLVVGLVAIALILLIGTQMRSTGGS